LFLLSGFANLSTKITNQREFKLSIFFAENKQSAIPLSRSHPLHDLAKMRSAKMISEVDYHFQSNNQFAER